MGKHSLFIWNKRVNMIDILLIMGTKKIINECLPLSLNVFKCAIETGSHQALLNSGDAIRGIRT